MTGTTVVTPENGASVKDPQHKGYLDLMKMDPRRLSIFQESFPKQPWFLWNMLGSKTSTPVDEDAIDFMTFWTDEDDHNLCPLPYVCHCDPGIPIEEFDAQKVVMESFKVPYMKTNVKITSCNPKYFEHQLRDIPGLPWNSMTPKQRINMFTAEMLRRQTVQMDVTEKHQFYNFLVYGRARFENPSVPLKDQWVDLGRDPYLQLEMPECEDWSLHPEADRIQHIRWIVNMLRDRSMKYSVASHHFFSPEARRCLFEGSKWRALQCCTGDGRVREDFKIDLLDKPAFRGGKRIKFVIGEDDEFFYEVDEKIMMSIETSPGQFVKKKVPVIPPGAVLTVAQPDLRPLSLYGRIHHLDVMESRKRWVNKYYSLDRSCVNFDSHSAPFHPLRGINSTLLWFPCPDRYPPPPNVKTKLIQVTDGD